LAPIEGAQAAKDVAINNCKGVPAKVSDPGAKPTKKKGETTAAFNKRKKAHAKAKKAFDKYSKAKKAYDACVAGANSQLEATVDGSDTSSDDGLTGGLENASEANDIAKQQQDQAAAAAYETTLATINGKYNSDGILSDYEYDVNAQVISTRRDNALMRSDRLFDEEADMIADAYRLNVRLIEDTYDLTDEDLGVSSTES
jgi:hypothetical protein